MCCRGEPGYVWVTPGEIREMAGHLGMSRQEFAGRYVRRVDMHLSLKERSNGDCVLWDGTCRVYPCRPSQCRTFPFWDDGLKSEAMFQLVSRGCPGVGKGRCYTCEEIGRIAAGLEDT